MRGAPVVHWPNPRSDGEASNLEKMLVMNRIGILVLGAAALLSAACTRKPVQVLDKTIPLPEQPDSYYLVRDAHGRACQFDLLFLIPIGGNQLWRAKDNGLGDDADGLIDVTVDFATLYTPVGRLSCTDVKGLAVRWGDPPPGYGPVVLRERVVIREEWVQVEAPADVDEPQPAAPSMIEPSERATSGVAHAEALAGFGLGGRGFGLSARELITVHEPGWYGGGDALGVGLGADLYLAGDRSLVVPVHVRYTLDNLAAQGLDIYGFGEIGFRRSAQGSGAGVHAGTGAGMRYSALPHVAAILELGYPAARGGVQVDF